MRRFLGNIRRNAKLYGDTASVIGALILFFNCIVQEAWISRYQAVQSQGETVQEQLRVLDIVGQLPYVAFHSQVRDEEVLSRLRHIELMIGQPGGQDIPEVDGAAAALRGAFVDFQRMLYWAQLREQAYCGPSLTAMNVSAYSSLILDIENLCREYSEIRSASEQYIQRINDMNDSWVEADQQDRRSLELLRTRMLDLRALRAQADKDVDERGDEVISSIQAAQLSLKEAIDTTTEAAGERSTLGELFSVILYVLGTLAVVGGTALSRILGDSPAADGRTAG